MQIPQGTDLPKVIFTNDGRVGEQKRAPAAQSPRKSQNFVHLLRRKWVPELCGSLVQSTRSLLRFMSTWEEFSIGTGRAMFRVRRDQRPRYQRVQSAAAELELRTCSRRRRRVAAQVKSCKNHFSNSRKKMCVRPRRSLHGRGATITLIFTGCVTAMLRFFDLCSPPSTNIMPLPYWPPVVGYNIIQITTSTGHPLARVVISSSESGQMRRDLN